MSPTWLRPSYWGIPLRSAIVSASVVMAALALGGVAVAALLYRQLVADVDDAAARRVGDLIAGLQTDSAQDLDAALLTTDQRSPSLIVDTVRGGLARAGLVGGHTGAGCHFLQAIYETCVTVRVADRRPHS